LFGVITPTYPEVFELADCAAQRNMTVSGDIIAHLLASTTGSNSDWVVKLFDVYPANDARMGSYQLMVASEIFRSRYLNSLRELKRCAGSCQPTQIDLHGNDYTFLKGHQIMVQVDSSWFSFI